jgi:vancomycin resistance protein YoaR
MARFVTPLDGRMSDQRHNAVLCLRELDGATIQPGETFSFNAEVGTWSRDKGYRRAPVSFGGLLVDSWGGGVCQTSSTLYNAALLAGLEVVERHRHHYAPTYIPPGRDAAVAYPNIDLKLRNPYDFPVVVCGDATQRGISVKIVGLEAPPTGVRIEQRVADVAPPDELVIGAGRYGRVRNPGHAGYSVATYRVLGDERELLSVDSYPVMNKVVEYKPGVE